MAKNQQPLPIQKGERIVYFGSNTPRTGVVKWVGELTDISKDVVAGIALDKPFGTNDGTWCKIRYFDCKPNHGVFVDVKALIKEKDFGEVANDESDDDISNDDEDAEEDSEEEKDEINLGDEATANSIDDWVKALEVLLYTGCEDASAEYAKRLARKKVKCKITRVKDDDHSGKDQRQPTATTKQLPVSPIKLNITVEKPDNEDDKFTTSVPKDCTLKKLKEKVHKMKGLSVDQQVWFFNDKMMQPTDDDVAIKDLNSDSPIVYIRELKWKCERCTLLNETTHLKCAACGAQWPQPVDGPADLKLEYWSLMEKEKRRQHDHKKLLEEKFKEYIKLDDIQIIKSKKEFECAICMTNIEPEAGIVLRDCLHSFCSECLAATIKHSEDIPVTCPYNDEYVCDSMIQEREIQYLLSDEDFIKYTDRLLAKAAGESRNSFYCKTPDCKGWCVYEYGAGEFNCPICKKSSCITCQAIHEGENCKQYQDRIKLEAENNETARKTQEAIKIMLQDGTAMVCPGCEVTIMKITGCDFIVCSHCKIAICWATKGRRWGPKGAGDTSEGCKCRSPLIGGQPCHPQCRSCH